MKKIILFLLAFGLITVGVFAADISGQVEMDIEISDLDMDTPTISHNDFSVELDITAAVDDFNSVTIQVRQDLTETFGIAVDQNGDGDTSDVGETSDVHPAGISDAFLESDLAGSFGWTDATGGLQLKIKSGYFKPETPEYGELKDITEVSDAANFEASNSWASTSLSAGWNDVVQLTVGLLFDTGESFQTIFSVNGDISAGPGTFGYLVYFGDNSTTAGFDTGNVGGGFQYKDVAVADDVTLGFGLEGFYDLDSEVVDNIGYGINVVADIGSWLDIDVSLGSKGSNSGISAESFLLGAGLGVGVSTEDGSLGAVFELAATNILGSEDNGNAPGLKINPEIYFKAGAARFTAGFEVSDALAKEPLAGSKVTLTSQLSF